MAQTVNGQFIMFDHIIRTDTFYLVVDEQRRIWLMEDTELQDVSFTADDLGHSHQVLRSWPFHPTQSH